jgi:hypothetical protein
MAFWSLVDVVVLTVPWLDAKSALMNSPKHVQEDQSLRSDGGASIGFVVSAEFQIVYQRAPF